MFFGDFGQSLGVGTVIPTNHHDPFHLSLKCADFLLSFVGGVADGIKYLDVRKTIPQSRNNRFKIFIILGSLGHHKGMRQLREPGHILCFLDDMGGFLAVPHKSDHFSVVFVAHNDGGAILAGLVTDNGLNTGNLGACGVDDPEPRIPERFPFMGRNAMGPNNNTTGGKSGGVIDGFDALGFEEIQNLFVVYERPKSKQGALLFIGFGHDHFHGPAHPHAEARCLGQYDFHVVSSPDIFCMAEKYRSSAAIMV